MPESPDASPRQPIPNDILRVIQKQCQSTDDEMRWLVARLSDTGMRLSEAVGILREDIGTEDKIFYVYIRPYPWRRLKTFGSKRKVPLVGLSLWAVKQALKASDGKFLFPKYCDEKGIHSNSASAALNKWLKSIAGPEYVIHSLRHSFRDRLRAVGCPSDMIDELGGWTSSGIGQAYGNGHALSTKCRELNCIAL